MNNNVNNGLIDNSLKELCGTINNLFSKRFYVYPSKSDFEQLTSIRKKKEVTNDDNLLKNEILENNYYSLVEPVEYCISNTQSGLKLTETPHRKNRMSFLRKKGLKGIRRISEVSKKYLDVANINARKNSWYDGNGLYLKLKSILNKIVKFGKGNKFSKREPLARRRWAESFYKKLKELQAHYTLLQKEIKSSKSEKILEMQLKSRGVWWLLRFFKLVKGKNYQKVSISKTDDSGKINDSNGAKEKKKDKVKGPEKPPTNNKRDSKSCTPTIDDMLKEIKNFKRDIRFYLAAAEKTDEDRRLGKLERAVWHLTVLLNKWKRYFTVGTTPNDCRVELVNILENCIQKIIAICDQKISIKDNKKGWTDYKPSNIESNQGYMEKFFEDWKTLKTTSKLMHNIKNKAGAYGLAAVIGGVTNLLMPAGLLGKAWEYGKSLFRKAGVKTEF